MPLGMGYTVEGQITGKEKFGYRQIIVYEPKLGKFSQQVQYELDCELESFSLDSMPMAASAAPKRTASIRSTSDKIKYFIDNPNKVSDKD